MNATPRWNAHGSSGCMPTAAPTRSTYPQQAAEFERRMRGDLPADFTARLPALLQAIAAKSDAVATRKAGQNALDASAPLLPEIFGGSADLTGSKLTNFKG